MMMIIICSNVSCGMFVYHKMASHLSITSQDAVSGPGTYHWLLK